MQPKTRTIVNGHLAHVRRGRPCKPATCQPVGRITLHRQASLYTHTTLCTLQHGQARSYHHTGGTLTPVQAGFSRHWYKALMHTTGLQFNTRLARNVGARYWQVTPPAWAVRALLHGCTALQRRQAQQVQAVYPAQ